jgi:acetylornithine/succinyldiaminopimelate/putrescine aminotransferase
VKPGDQGTTFGGGPLASVAMETIAHLIRELDLPGNAARVGAHLHARLPELAGVRSVGGLGLLVGVNLDRPAKGVVAALREQGVLSGGCEGDPHQLRLLPPLTLTIDEADEFVAALSRALAAVPR